MYVAQKAGFVGIPSLKGPFRIFQGGKVRKNGPSPGSFSLQKLRQMAIYCAKDDLSYDIGAEGKAKINEARGNYFVDPYVTLWGHFF